MKVKGLILVGACVLALSCSNSSSPSQPLTSEPAPPAPPANAPPSSTATPASNAVAEKSGSAIDPCKVLTSDELQAVLGEPLKETKASERPDGGFHVSQCFYSLPTLAKSVSVSITSRGTRDPREFWKETFHREDAAEKEREREKEKRGSKSEKDERREKGQREEEEESAPPQKVGGIGEEAFWMSSPIGGALYVLQKNAFVRISIGGSDDQKTRLNKSKALATKILGRV
ncbi:MAG: hypothetical protein QOE77_2384 [Blastocatellia bacterium]|nr:hypothetical protein [Blastocatellia bacterium]